MAETQVTRYDLYEDCPNCKRKQVFSYKPSVDKFLYFAHCPERCGAIKTARPADLAARKAKGE